MKKATINRLKRWRVYSGLAIFAMTGLAYNAASRGGWGYAIAAADLAVAALNLYNFSRFDMLIKRLGWRPPLPCLQQLIATKTFASLRTAVNAAQRSTGTP